MNDMKCEELIMYVLDNLDWFSIMPKITEG